MYKMKLVLFFPMLLVACSSIGPFFGHSEDPPVRDGGTSSEKVVSQNQELNAEIAALRQELKDLQDSIERKQAEEKARLKAKEAASREVVPADRLWVTVSFRSGFMKLTKQSRKALAKLAGKFMSKPRAQSLDVRGYTDNEPIGGYPGKRHQPNHSYKTNLALSEARTDAVASALIEAGIPGSKIHAQGYGATDFVASNKTASGRAKNRRTEIHLVRQ